MEHAINFFVMYPDTPFCVLLAAGIRPDKPHYPLMKKIMSDYLQERFEEEIYYKRLRIMPEIRMTQADGWSTFKESLAALHELRLMNRNDVYVGSSWYHIPRILFIWLIIGGFAFQVYPVWAPSPRVKSMLSEVASFLKVFWYWFEWKFRR